MFKEHLFYFNCVNAPFCYQLRVNVVFILINSVKGNQIYVKDFLC